MNIQRVDDAVFLAYIAKYITKPEPNGILADTDELRARENMSDAERNKVWLLRTRRLAASCARYLCTSACEPYSLSTRCLDGVIKYVRPTFLDYLYNHMTVDFLTHSGYGNGIRERNPRAHTRNRAG